MTEPRSFGEVKKSFYLFSVARDRTDDLVLGVIITKQVFVIIEHKKQIMIFYCQLREFNEDKSFYLQQLFF